jgi:4-amino-4-deoxychorismate lyase
LYLYLNGEMISSEQATISIFDHGYLYGVGLFETFRTYNGHPFLLENHLDRLAQGCQQVGMIWEREVECVKEQIAALLQKNQLEDGYFRLNVSAGSQPIGLPSQPYTDLTEALFVKALPPRAAQKRLSTVKTKRNTPEGPYRLKSHHYLNNILAKQEAPLDAEGVFLTAEGKVAEGIVSNLFFIRQGELFTPSLSTGILNGITRECVLHLAKKLDLQVHQGEYDLAFAQEAEEVFVTNSIQEIMPVIQWDGQTYDQPTEASVTYRLKQQYDRYKERIHRIDEMNDQSAE